MVPAIMASASIPLFFEPTKIDDMVLVDGGLFSNLQINEAIHKCRDHGFDDKDIIIDVIMIYSTYLEMQVWNKEKFKFKNAYELH